MDKATRRLGLWSAMLGFALLSGALPMRTAAQDEQDDPPTRVARLGYMEGEVSFQPAGEDDWVGAVPNRPLTTGDKLWSDTGSRAALELGSAAIRLSEYTGVSFLNLDDNTVQVQLSSGTINVRVWRLRPDDDFEIDTPNLAFVITSPGNYRIYADQDGGQTTVAVREGNGEATGNGETYTLQSGQVGYFSGADSLYADVEPLGPPDPFDVWTDRRDDRYEHSRSTQYLSADVVGYEDLDDYGDWRDDPSYGHVWFPNRVAYGWAPYHEGHWVWINPWGYTWVDDSPWGYAPFHYGRWVFVAGRWGWIAGPPAVAPVYAPALVVFVGGGGGWGGNVGWFPLGPREVYVPTYPVSQTYMTQINVSNTTVNTIVVTNVYNATIVNKTTTITNITYVNKTVPGAVTAVPQNAFASAQPVAKVAVKVTPQQVAAAPMTTRVAVAPTQQAMLGAKASTAGHVAAPPAAAMSRPVVAKKAPPPPPVPVAKQLQAMAAHPGQPLARKEMASLRPAAPTHPAVKVAPPGKPAVATTGHAPPPRPGQPVPAKPAQPARPAQPAPAAKVPENRPPTPQPNRPPEAQPARPPQKNPPAARPATPPPPPHPPAARPAAPVPQQHPPAPAAKPAPPPQKKPQTPEEKKKEEQKPPGA
jgi:FecR protein